VRYTYIRPFTDAAQVVLEQALSSRIIAGDIQLSATTVASRGVTTIVGITGEADGRVLFDMAPACAVRIAQAMNGETTTELDKLGQDTLAELASMIAGRAVTILNDVGHKLQVSPPTLLIGDNLTISNFELETLIVPLETSFGDVVVNVAFTTC
jgi:chemotaxis protein CheX